MPKKVLFESSINQIVRSANRALSAIPQDNGPAASALRQFIGSLTFVKAGKKDMVIRWQYPISGEALLDFSAAAFYVQGDHPDAVKRQSEQKRLFSPDEVQERNRTFYDGIIAELISAALNGERSQKPSALIVR